MRPLRGFVVKLNVRGELQAAAYRKGPLVVSYALQQYMGGFGGR